MCLLAILTVVFTLLDGYDLSKAHGEWLESRIHLASYENDALFETNNKVALFVPAMAPG